LGDQVKEEDKGAWSTHEKRNIYKILVGKPEGTKPLGRPRRRWEDNIRMDLKEIGWQDLEWLHLAQDRDQLRAPATGLLLPLMYITKITKASSLQYHAGAETLIFRAVQTEVTGVTDVIENVNRVELF
jgi:hypothetical protein